MNPFDKLPAIGTANPCGLCGVPKQVHDLPNGGLGPAIVGMPGHMWRPDPDWKPEHDNETVDETQKRLEAERSSQALSETIRHDRERW